MCEVLGLIASNEKKKREKSLPPAQSKMCETTENLTTNYAVKIREPYCM
jgi:hypothetical protein